MPWLVTEDEATTSKEALLFIHVPRCGGTSLTKHFRVLRKAIKSRPCPFKFSLAYFGYRYNRLESANFPLVTIENFYAACVFTTWVVLTAVLGPAGYTWFLLSHSIFVFCFSTFFITAPCLRSLLIRKAWLCMLRIIGANSLSRLYGGDTRGFYIHLTAPRLLHTGMVSKEVLQRVSSFAIVRNPFSRMVSVYMYNRCGPLESFSGFVRRFEKQLKHALEARAARGLTTPIEEWEIYCHALPMVDFTHDADGSQIVQYVIKQEELKSMRSSSPLPSVANLSGPLKQALLDMPHANNRKRGKPWHEFYDAETEAIVLGMYRKDFEVFGYDTSLDALRAKSAKSPGVRAPVKTHSSTNCLCNGHSSGALSAAENGSADGARNGSANGSGLRQAPETIELGAVQHSAVSPDSMNKRSASSEVALARARAASHKGSARRANDSYKPNGGKNGTAPLAAVLVVPTNDSETGASAPCNDSPETRDKPMEPSDSDDLRRV
mmetsp:Transcript_28596/g.62564  ORF Transcript_28596/g.62564 Transcript_28596/m.62564 type:complete len:493 (-) Transcript_28596:705-2183(-)